MAQFCTVADLEAFLQLTIPASLTASATRAIEEASAAIANYCRQQLEEVEDDELTFDVAAGCNRLFLPELPVTAVVSVEEDGETLAEDDDYKLGQHGILYRVGQNWYPGVQTVTVTYTHGYATLPQDVIDVATRAAARAYQAGLRASSLEGVPGVQAESLGDHSVTYNPEAGGGDSMLGASAAPLLLRSEMRILDRYRL